MTEITNSGHSTTFSNPVYDLESDSTSVATDVDLPSTSRDSFRSQLRTGDDVIGTVILSNSKRSTGSAPQADISPPAKVKPELPPRPSKAGILVENPVYTDEVSDV